MNNNQIPNEESEQINLSNRISLSKILETKEILILNQVPIQLHSAQQEINNLRLLNICLQSTLIRVQTQLIEYLPINIHDEIKRNEIKQKLISLRQNDDHSRRIIDSQQISFFQIIDNFKNLLDIKQKQEQINNKDISLIKNEKQIDILYEMFHELNTIIHTEHNDRICQLYITLAETSHSVNQTQEILDHTIHAHKIITRRKMKRKIFLIFIAFIFISIFIFIIIISIRIH
ncbi:unnamed protein product [Rotaria sordida]|uniref:Uncharacterized protein n=1 Tax=Rotaria sordida TaxID=392033 RepID=A0A813TCH5_9BILA|nr:unnamed protein product [Rotaria sordida]CAF0951312.1 unnamed protein product [Rotaria sordida]CAF0991457.1 unnamed protein product [Rotaria sordida]CAF3770411.1 unnamed protein product [Rotaria sordida]